MRHLAWPALARRSVLLTLLAVLLLVPGPAQAGNRSMIPPGREQAIRDMVEHGLATAELGGPFDLNIDRDRIHVDLREPDGPRFVIAHPAVELEDGGEALTLLAPGVLISCGPAPQPRPCLAAEHDRWRGPAEALARARDPVATEIWVIEETGVPPSAGHDGARSDPSMDRGVDSWLDSWLDPGVGRWVDKLGAVFTLLCGLGLAIWAANDRRRRGQGIPLREWLVLAALLALFVGLTLGFTELLPLHEHNSFVARSDCAIDDHCADDPVGAWSPTTFPAYQLLLSAIPYEIPWLSRVSLALSVLDLMLLWGLTRTLMSALGRPRLAPVAGLSAVAVLVVHPVFWRLAGSASFWPWSLAWILGALLAGLWASRLLARGEAPGAGGGTPGARVAGVLGWIVAATALAFSAAGNLVCLTLGTLLILAPLCWTRWRPVSLVHTALVALPALGLFTLLVAEDYLLGIVRVSTESGYGLAKLVNHFTPLLLRPQVSTWVWAPALVLSGAWLVPGLARLTDGDDRPVAAGRTLIPVLYAWLVPGAFLGAAAEELIDSGYPVGFINHHWELMFTASLAGLGVAWLVGVASRQKPEWTWAALIPGTLLALAAVTGAYVDEGWRMATGERVNERELVALQASFTALPAHDILVIAPRLQPPIDGVELQGDPIEIWFPLGAYAHALRQQGHEPALVVALDSIPDPRPGQRVLVYVGTALRSFQYREIEAGAVPDSLERPALHHLRDAWTLEPALEFELRSDQHEAIITRLGADRVPSIQLGFYWLRPRD